MRRSGSTNECHFCGQFFAGPKPYDRHFHPDDATCLTPEALRAAGLQLSDAGFWIAPRSVAFSTDQHEVTP
jgi:hypothetical protein